MQLDGIVAHRRQLHPPQAGAVAGEQRHQLGVVEQRPRPERVGVGELAPHGVRVAHGDRVDAVARRERLELRGEDVGSDHDAHPRPSFAPTVARIPRARTVIRIPRARAPPAAFCARFPAVRARVRARAAIFAVRSTIYGKPTS